MQVPNSVILGVVAANTAGLFFSFPCKQLPEMHKEKLKSIKWISQEWRETWKQKIEMGPGYHLDPNELESSPDLMNTTLRVLSTRKDSPSHIICNPGASSQAESTASIFTKQPRA